MGINLCMNILRVRKFRQRPATSEIKWKSGFMEENTDPRVVQVLIFRGAFNLSCIFDDFFRLWNFAEPNCVLCKTFGVRKFTSRRLFSSYSVRRRNI